MEKGLSLSVIQPHFCEAIFTCKIIEMRSSAVNWKSIWKYPQSEVKFLNQASFKIYRKNWFFYVFWLSHTRTSHGMEKWNFKFHSKFNRRWGGKRDTLRYLNVKMIKSECTSLNDGKEEEFFHQFLLPKYLFWLNNGPPLNFISIL